MPTKIEWTGETWNPVRARLLSEPARVGWHCTHASSGCINCYAERINLRGIGTGLPYKPGHEKDIEIYIDDKVLTRPFRWARPRFIFPGSMTDLFADFVTDAMLDRIMVVPALTERHTYQFLTKRPDRLRDYFAGGWRERVARLLRPMRPKGMSDGAIIYHAGPLIAPGYLPNIWIGTSVEDDRVRERIDILREVPAAVRWLSIEPMIGPIPNIDLTGINWVVLGGESGRGARPMYPDWAREIRDACVEQGVPFFFKQWGAWGIDDLPVPKLPDPALAAQHGRISMYQDGTFMGRGFFPEGSRNLVHMHNVGKKAAGRLLDGVLHDGMPETT